MISPTRLSLKFSPSQWGKKAEEPYKGDIEITCTPNVQAVLIKFILFAGTTPNPKTNVALMKNAMGEPKGATAEWTVDRILKMTIPRTASEVLEIKGKKDSASFIICVYVKTTDGRELFRLGRIPTKLRKNNWENFFTASKSYVNCVENLCKNQGIVIMGTPAEVKAWKEATHQIAPEEWTKFTQESTEGKKEENPQPIKKLKTPQELSEILQDIAEHNKDPSLADQYRKVFNEHMSKFPLINPTKGKEGTKVVIGTTDPNVQVYWDRVLIPLFVDTENAGQYVCYAPASLKKVVTVLVQVNGVLHSDNFTYEDDSKDNSTPYALELFSDNSSSSFDYSPYETTTTSYTPSNIEFMTPEISEFEQLWNSRQVIHIQMTKTKISGFDTNQNASIWDSNAEEEEEESEEDEKFQVTPMDIDDIDPPKIDPNSVNPHINPNQLEVNLKHHLGKGSLGNFFLGKFQNIPVAVQCIQVQLTKPKDLENFENEVRKLMTLNHKNVTKCYGYCKQNGEPRLVYEYMENGSLKNWIEKNKEIPIGKVYSILKEIAMAMRYVHKMYSDQERFHMALKSNIVMFDSDMHVKISDFGLLGTSQLDMSYSARSIFEGAQWLAPEHLIPSRIKERSHKGDIFAFGVIAWELVTGKVPWAGRPYLDVIDEVAKKGGRLEIPENCPEKLRELIKECWENEPGKRPMNLVDRVAMLA